MKDWACLAVVTGAACAAHGAPSGATGGAPAPMEAAARRNSLVITEAELSAPAVRSMSVYEAIAEMRPHFLTVRGAVGSHGDPELGKVHVSIDGLPIVALSELNSMHVNGVLEIRFLDAGAAMQRFGGSARQGPVILVRTR